MRKKYFYHSLTGDRKTVRREASNRNSVAVIARHEAICVANGSVSKHCDTDCFVPRNHGHPAILIAILL